MFAVTVGRIGSRMGTVCYGGWSQRIPLWGIKLYKAVPRVKDGTPTFRYIDYIGRPRCEKYPSRKLIREAKEWAEEQGYPFLAQVKHGSSADEYFSELEYLAYAGQQSLKESCGDV